MRLIDRERDSVCNIRNRETTDSLWLVRVKDNPKVDFEEKPMACKAVVQQLTFGKTRHVSYHGKAGGSIVSCLAIATCWRIG
ncbi:MAG: hypothetical protein KGZ88_12255 [Methylomicrobium sp.]|nr:hypothetical protein [Methylomicrobium sp.]